MKLLTVKELSEILNVSPKTLYQWVELGQIPSHKLVRSVRFDWDQIQKWLQKNEKGPSPRYNIPAQPPRA